jgi:CheY-like chemotaxis protein
MGQEVLVVDDDPDIRESMCEILKDEGLEPVCVENGRVALEYLRAGGHPSVILLDLMMPVMDGWTFLDQKDADPDLAEIPVAVISAFAERSAPARLPRDHVLQKPLELDAVLGVIHQHTDHVGHAGASVPP